MSHSHSHDDSSAPHEFSSTAPLPPSPQNYIYTPLDFPQIQVLNEAVPGSGRAVLEKGWANHLNPLPELASAAVSDDEEEDSDSDEEENEGEILLYIPFTAHCRLTHLLLTSSPSPSAPSTIHLYSNPPGSDLDFATAADLPPTQTLHAVQANGLQELPLQRAKWGGVRAVGVYIKGNHATTTTSTTPTPTGVTSASASASATGTRDTAATATRRPRNTEQTRLSFLGFRGEWTELRRDAVEILYEAAANPRDHAPVVGTGGLGTGSRIGGA